MTKIMKYVKENWLHMIAIVLYFVIVIICISYVKANDEFFVKVATMNKKLYVANYDLKIKLFEVEVKLANAEIEITNLDLKIQRIRHELNLIKRNKEEK